ITDGVLPLARHACAIPHAGSDSLTSPSLHDKSFIFQRRRQPLTGREASGPYGQALTAPRACCTVRPAVCRGLANDACARRKGQPHRFEATSDCAAAARSWRNKSATHPPSNPAPLDLPLCVRGCRRERVCTQGDHTRQRGAGAPHDCHHHGSSLMRMRSFFAACAFIGPAFVSTPAFCADESTVVSGKVFADF